MTKVALQLFALYLSLRGKIEGVRFPIFTRSTKGYKFYITRRNMHRTIENKLKCSRLGDYLSHIPGGKALVVHVQDSRLVVDVYRVISSVECPATTSLYTRRSGIDGFFVFGAFEEKIIRIIQAQQSEGLGYVKDDVLLRFNLPLTANEQAYVRDALVQENPSLNAPLLDSDGDVISHSY